MPQCYNTSLADHAHTEGNKSELFPWIRNNNPLSCKQQQQQQVGTWRNNYTVLPHGNLAEVRCSWRHKHEIPDTKMAARRPFLVRLSNPVSPHVFPLIHVTAKHTYHLSVWIFTSSLQIGTLRKNTNRTEQNPEVRWEIKQHRVKRKQNYFVVHTACIKKKSKKIRARALKADS